MEHDIVIARDGDHYRVLYGYLHIVNRLSTSAVLWVRVKGEGSMRVIGSPLGWHLLPADGQPVPLLALPRVKILPGESRHSAFYFHAPRAVPPRPPRIPTGQPEPQILAKILPGKSR